MYSCIVRIYEIPWWRTIADYCDYENDVATEIGKYFLNISMPIS